MPNGDFARYRWIVDSCLETHNNVNQPAGYLRCNGEKSLATVKQLDDLYGAFIKQLRWDVDSMLSVWHNVLGIKPKPFAWSLAAGIGGEAYGVMGAGFNLVAVEIAASCKAEFPQSHPDTGATSMFVCECLWKWLARQNLDQGVLPDLVCGGVPCGGYSTVSFLGVRSSKERWVKQLRVHLERMTENLKKTERMAWFGGWKMCHKLLRTWCTLHAYVVLRWGCRCSGTVCLTATLEWLRLFVGMQGCVSAPKAHIGSQSVLWCVAILGANAGATRINYLVRTRVG